MILDIISIGLSLFVIYNLIDLIKEYNQLKNNSKQTIYNLNLDLENLNLKFNNDDQEFCKSVAGAIYENDDILKYDKDKNLAYNYLVMQEVINIMLKNQYKEKE